MMMRNKQEELKQCTFIKVILMLLIVLSHSMAFWRGNWFTSVELENPIRSIGILTDWLAGFHVYTFTLVSGFIFYYMKFEKGSYKEFAPFLSNKFKRLIVPYLTVSVLWVVPITAFFEGEVELKWLVEDYVLGTNPSQLWFLLMLFWVFVGAYLMADFFKKHNFLSLVVVVALYMIGLLGNFVDIPNLFGILTACKHIIMFWLGFKLAQEGTIRMVLYKVPWFVWLVLYTLVFLGSLVVENYTDIMLVKLLSKGVEFILHSVGAVMAWMVLEKVGEKVHWIMNKKIYVLFAKSSMIVYLLHQQMIYFLIYWFNGKINPWFHILLNFSLSLTFSILISMVALRSKKCRFLLGEK